MKDMQLLRHAAAWLAVCGMCLPSVVLGQQPDGAPGMPATAPSPAIHDVALQPGGVLIGQIVDITMAPQRDATVMILTNGQTAAATTTDQNGIFAVSGLRGGVHQVVAGESVRVCRMWTPGTAPPQAVSHLRLIPDQGTVVRGQWGPPPSYKSLATNPWLIGGIVATAIAVPVLLHNLDDDDDNGS